MAAAGTNIYDLLSNDEQHSKKPQEKDGPGKPDKSENRRSVPRGGAAAGAGAGAGGRGGSSAPASGAQGGQRGPRVDDRDRRGGRGGAAGAGAGRGGRGGGRGGYHGGESDGVHRNFDRKQGEHQKHAPGEARKHGAVGEANPSAFSGSSAEFAEQDAAATADANGDIIGDEILDITPMPTDPDDSKMTYDEYLAQRARPDDDVNRQTREVSEDQQGDFKAVKPLKKVEEGIFGEALSPKDDGEEKSGGAAGGKKPKKKISLDEFVGERPAAASSSERGGRGGGRGGASERGGRGGFQGESRGGRGGFQGESRGGRGGFQGESRGGRGGRGGFDGARGGRGGAGAPRGGARGGAAANVNIADQSAFPALSPK